MNDKKINISEQEYEDGALALRKSVRFSVATFITGLLPWFFSFFLIILNSLFIHNNIYDETWNVFIYASPFIIFISFVIFIVIAILNTIISSKVSAKLKYSRESTSGTVAFVFSILEIFFGFIFAIISLIFTIKASKELKRIYLSQDDDSEDTDYKTNNKETFGAQEIVE